MEITHRECNKCKMILPISSFYQKNLDRPPSRPCDFQSHCKECHKSVKKHEWKEKTAAQKEHIALRQHNWYQKNKHRVMKEAKDRLMEDPVYRKWKTEKEAAKRLKKSKDAVRLANRRWVQGLDIDTRFLWSKFKDWKINALRRKIDWSLTFEDLLELFKKSNKICHYTGEKLETTANSKNTLSLDRIDSDKGYSTDNIVFCTTIINRMKLDSTLEEFEEIMKKALSYKDNWVPKETG